MPKIVKTTTAALLDTKLVKPTTYRGQSLNVSLSTNAFASGENGLMWSREIKMIATTAPTIAPVMAPIFVNVSTSSWEFELTCLCIVVFEYH